MLDRINVKYFLVSFCFGILLVYVINPKGIVIRKFPSPDNIDTIYTDNNDGCYKYNYTEVKCSEETQPQPQPVIDSDSEVIVE
jgi:hypothetical protein